MMELDNISNADKPNVSALQTTVEYILKYNTVSLTLANNFINNDVNRDDIEQGKQIPVVQMINNVDMSVLYWALQE